MLIGKQRDSGNAGVKRTAEQAAAKAPPPAKKLAAGSAAATGSPTAAVVAALLYWFQDATQPERDRTLTIEDTQTLAVLPFADMTPSGDQEYLADGLSEELLTRLGRLDADAAGARDSA